MNRYRVMTEARNDLDEIYRYIARDNRAAAKRLQSEFIKRFRMLADHPRLGPPRFDLADEIRITAVGTYAILYRPIHNGVEIIQVVHSSRDLPAVFRMPSE